MNSKQKVNEAGFSLIEMILYVGILSIFLTGAIYFGWSSIYGRIKSQVQLDVNYNLNFITKKIGYEIKNASAINSVASSDICLASADSARNPTRFYLASGVLRVAWGGGTTNCTSMTNDQPLSSDSVNISNLVFTDLSSVGGETKNIKFDITVDSNNPSNRSEWNASQSYSSSVEIRSN